MNYFNLNKIAKIPQKELQPTNPFAVCNSVLGTKKTKKHQRCIHDIKSKNKKQNEKDCDTMYLDKKADFGGYDNYTYEEMDLDSGQTNKYIQQIDYFAQNHEINMLDALYLFLSQNHQGQASQKYQALSHFDKIGYKPSPILSMNSLDQMGKELYNELSSEQTVGTESHDLDSQKSCMCDSRENMQLQNQEFYGSSGVKLYPQQTMDKTSFNYFNLIKYSGVIQDFKSKNKSSLIGRTQVLKYLRQHGFQPDELTQTDTSGNKINGSSFYDKFGVLPFYDIQEVKQWLGY